MKKIKCGIIGLGMIGENHLRALKQIPFAEVIAICRRDKKKLVKVAKKYNIPKYYINYKDLLNDNEIEMVTIGTPIKSHYKISIDAINAGKHVFLETPMALNSGECDKIIEAHNKTQNYFMVGHICRFDTEYALTKEKIEAGKIGKILSIHAWRNVKRVIADDVINDISSFLGDGIHDVDLAFWFTNSKPVNVYAQTIKTRKDIPNNDIGWAIFRLSNKSILIIENIWCLPDSVNYEINAGMKIVGTQGVIKINSNGNNYSILTNEMIENPESKYWPVVYGKARGYLKEEIEYFLSCIINKKEPSIITPLEARDAVFAMKMAELSAQNNRILNF